MITRVVTLLFISLAIASHPARAQLLLSGPNTLSFTATAGGPAPAPQQVSVGHTGSPQKTFAVSVATASGGSWLTASTSGGVTPARLTVFANPAGLPPGLYTGAITIMSPAVPNVQVAVSLMVVSASQLGSEPSSLLFLRNTTSDITTGEQLVLVSASGSAITYRVAATTSDSNSWLLASVLSSSTPGVVSVRVNPGGLGVGTYTGNVAISSDTALPLNVPVTLVISGNPFLTTSPTLLNFAVTRNGAPSTRQLNVIANGGTVAVSASTATTSGGNWLIASPLFSSAPGSLDISVNPSGLSAGNYSGSILISAPNAANSTIVVPVALTVTDFAIVSATPASIDTAYTLGASNPIVNAQTLQVTALQAGTTFTVATATSTGGPWLTAGPASTTVTAAGQNHPVTVQIDASGLASGQYRGWITVTGPGNSITIPVSLQVTNTAALAVDVSTITFNLQRNQSPPSNQLVNITSTGAAYNYQTAVTAISPAGGTWLTGGTSNGTTPGLLTLGVNAQATSTLANGQYTATITVTGQPGIAPVSPNSPAVNVVLNVSDTPQFNISPSFMDFTVPFGGAAPPLRLITVTATDNSAQTFTAAASTTSGGSWLLVGPTTGNTPANITVSAVPAGLGPGIYDGSVSITVPSISLTPQMVRVRLVIQPAVTIAVTPGLLSFAQTRGGAAPNPQSLNISSNGNAGFQVTVSTASGGAWLSATPTAGSTPGSVLIAVNGTSLAAGTYTGSIGISSADVNNSPIAIPVSLTVNAASLTVMPTLITLVAAPGATQSVTQQLSISAGGSFAPFTLTASTISGGQWLSVSPATGTTSQTVTVSANPFGLPLGSYTGAIQVNVSGIGIVTVPVTLIIASAPTMAATPASLAFDYSLGSATPAVQSVALSTTGINLSYIVTSATQSGGNWLTVTPGSGITPSSLTVGVRSGNLAPGAYAATITVTSSAANNPLTIGVSLTVRPGRQLLSQIAEGAGWKTGIILVNLDTVAANYTLRFYSSDGSPLRLPLDVAPGRLESVEGTIPVGGSRTITTLGTDTTLSQGWAELTSTRLVNGLAVFRQRAEGRPDQEAGVSTTSPSARFILPFDNTQGFVSSMALVNTNTSNARAIAASPRDETGVTLAGDSVNLPARGHAAFVMSDRFPSMAQRRGAAEFNAPSGADFSALGLRFNPGGAFTSLPTLDVPAPGARPVNQVISQIADGSGWKTSITLVNLDNVATPFTIRFWRQIGTALGVPIEGVAGTPEMIEGTIPVGGSRTIFTAGGNTDLVQGWAELVTTRSIGGVAVFRQRGTGRPDQEAAVTLTTSSNRFALPFDNTDNFVTSMALVNVNSGFSQTINVVIRDEAGTQIGADTIALSGRGHTAFPLPDRLPATRNRRGVVEFSASGPDITGLGLRFNPGGAFTSFPVLPKP